MTLCLRHLFLKSVSDSIICSGYSPETVTQLQRNTPQMYLVNGMAGFEVGIGGHLAVHHHLASRGAQALRLK